MSLFVTLGFPDLGLIPRNSLVLSEFDRNSL